MKPRIISGIYIGLTMVILVILVAYADMVSDNPNTLIISEVCSRNNTTAHDEIGSYGSDYIEIYNGTDETINLKGYGLSDSRDDLYRFVMPNVELASHAAIVVWCNPMEQDLTQYAEDFVVRDIRGADFSNSSKGENVYLTDPDGSVVSAVTVVADIPDGYAYQTALEDPDDYVVGEPTLYTVAKSFDEIVGLDSHELEKPIFSMDGGWYDDAVMVALSCAEGEIYYTLDGSIPDEYAIRYDGPIRVTNRSDEPNIYAAIDTVSNKVTYIPNKAVDKCTVIKAIAIEGGQHSEVAVQSYFVGLDAPTYENMAVVSLTMDPDDLFDNQDGIYVLGTVYDRNMEKSGEADALIANYAMEGKGWEREAQIEFYTETHEEVLRQQIGVRIHGGASVANNQKSFNLYAREAYDGNEEFQYDFFGRHYSRLMLQTGGAQDTYVTKFRDVFMQSLVTDRNIGCQQAIPCVVFLNGEYWGFYHLQEQTNESYIEANYGLEEEDVVVLKNPWELAETDDDARDYMDLVDYAAEHDMSDDSQFAYVEERMDIQSYIDYWCTEIYVSNCDSMINNYAIWRSREAIDDAYGDGRWRWLLYDMEGAAGMFAEYSEADTDSFLHMHGTNNLLGEDEYNDDLFTALIANESFKAQFIATFLEMADTNFAYEKVHERLYEMAERYCDAVVASQQRFRGDYTPGGYEAGSAYTSWYTESDYWSDVQVIDDFFRKRKGYIVDDMYRDLEMK